MDKEIIEKFDKDQLDILLNDLQDIDKFTGFKDGAFKYELGKYQANLLVNCIKKQKEVIDKIYKKCQSKKGQYDYDVWLKLNDNWKTLSDFIEHIKYNLHPIITEAYQCDIKNSINQMIEITKNDVVLKEDILDILNEVSE